MVLGMYRGEGHTDALGLPPHLPGDGGEALGL